MAKSSPPLAIRRCPWAEGDLNAAYHDAEWGVPVHDDRRLFEFLILEGAQAGLSWVTILKKRDSYRAAFDQFDPAIIVNYGHAKRDELMANPGIVRNRLKIDSTIQNAGAFLQIQQEFGSFDAYVWSFVGGEPVDNRWTRMKDLMDATTGMPRMTSRRDPFRNFETHENGSSDRHPL